MARPRGMDDERDQWLEASYEEDYHGKIHGRLIDDALYYELKALEAKSDLFDGVSSDSEVFEFGVGVGKNIALLDKKCGYDISSFARSFSKKQGIPVFGDMAEVPDGKFDVVLSSHVLEHLDNPLENLKLLSTKLKSGGRLILVLPVEKHRNVSFAIDVDQHLYAWNFRTINNLLQRAGFEVKANRFRYGTAQYKLRYLGKLSFRLYRFHTRLLGRLLNRRDMIIVAEKR